MTESIRFGSPPSAPRKPRRKPWVLWVCVGLVAAGLIGGGAVYGVAMARQDSRGSGGFASWAMPPAPTPSSNPANEAVTCSIMVPLLQDSAEEMTALLNDPERSTVKAAATVGSLKALQIGAPAAWQEDIEAQYTALQQMVDAKGDPGKIVAIDENSFGDSGVRLARNCLPYAAS
jgi:hypothetical protein